MTVRQARVIDWLGIEKESGHVLLTIVDDIDWVQEQEHVLALQEKLNAYLAFVESGEVFRKLSEEVRREVPKGTPIKVSILAKYELTPRSRAFVEHAKAAFASAGLVLTFKIVALPS